MPAREQVCEIPVKRRLRGPERGRTQSGSRRIRDRRANRTSNSGCSGGRHMLVWRDNLERTPSHADQRVLLGYLFRGCGPQQPCDPAYGGAGPRRHGKLRTPPRSATVKPEGKSTPKHKRLASNPTFGLTCAPLAVPGFLSHSIFLHQQNRPYFISNLTNIYNPGIVLPLKTTQKRREIPAFFISGSTLPVPDSKPNALSLSAPHNAVRKSFACHSYKNRGGVP